MNMTTLVQSIWWILSGGGSFQVLDLFRWWILSGEGSCPAVDIVMVVDFVRWWILSCLNDLLFYCGLLNKHCLLIIKFIHLSIHLFNYFLSLYLFIHLFLIPAHTGNRIMYM